MEEKRHIVTYQVLEGKESLTPSDRNLLELAEGMTAKAYAPYSHFHVGAAVLLANGEIFTGSNQENASFPVGLCGERVALFAAGAAFPDVPVVAIAITVANENGSPSPAAAPCGMCRQAIAEYEMRHQQGIRLILGGETPLIYVVPRAGDLLPLAFDAAFLQRHKPE